MSNEALVIALLLLLPTPVFVLTPQSDLKTLQRECKQRHLECSRDEFRGLFRIATPITRAYKPSFSRAVKEKAFEFKMAAVAVYEGASPTSGNEPQLHLLFRIHAMQWLKSDPSVRFRLESNEVIVTEARYDTNTGFNEFEQFTIPLSREQFARLAHSTTASAQIGQYAFQLRADALKAMRSLLAEVQRVAAQQP